MVGRTLGFLIIRRVLGILGLGRSPDAKDVEIAVLRHQDHGAEPSGGASPVHRQRPTRAGYLVAGSAPDTVGGLSRHPRDVIALAP